MFSGSILALSAVFVFPAGAASMPAPASPCVAFDEAKTDEGSIKSVDTVAKSFVLAVGAGPTARDISIKVDDKTTYTLDGKASTMAEALKAGHRAKVKHTSGVANSVDATTVKTP